MYIGEVLLVIISLVNLITAMIQGFPQGTLTQDIGDVVQGLYSSHLLIGGIQD